MPDMEVSWGVDDSQLNTGLAAIGGKNKAAASRLEREWGNAGKSIAKSFLGMGNVGGAAMMGIGAGVGIGIKALDSYAKKNDMARDAQAALGRDAASMWDQVGMAATAAATQQEGAWGAVANAVRNFYRESLNYDWSGNYVGTYDAIKAGEMQQKQITSTTESRRMRDEMNVDRFEKDGNFVDAAQLRAKLRRERVMKDAQAKGIFGKDLTDIQNELDAQADRDVREAQQRQNDRDRKRAQDDRRYEKQRRSRLDDIGDQLEQGRIENMRSAAQVPGSGDVFEQARAKGLERTANLAAIELDLRRRLRDVQRDELLTAEERGDLMQKIGDQAKEQATIEMRRKEAFEVQNRMMAGGFTGSASLERAIFGYANREGAAAPQRVMENQLEVLKRIERNTADARTAVLGP
jgi:hypothetical protein